MRGVDCGKIEVEDSDAEFIPRVIWWGSLKNPFNSVTLVHFRFF